jgi:hypothetical protein
MNMRVNPQLLKVQATFLLTLCSILPFNACKKETTREQFTTTPALRVDPDDAYRVAFAKTLAKAVQAEPALRNFIKAEATKQFDRDYDILFQAVKDTRIEGHTIQEILAQYADDPEAFETACEKLPLLTIFMPTLPNGFSADNWNTGTDVPLVALKQQANADMSFYDAKGNEQKVPGKYIPGFPVLVVKNNERVVVNGAPNYFADPQARQQTASYYRNSSYSFSFADESFDGVHKKSSADAGRVALAVDPINIQAYSSGAEWQRDFVYYGIKPGVDTGKFTNHYSEFITSFKFLKPEHYNLVSDHANDPTTILGLHGKDEPVWTDGNLEIRISIFVNAKNAVGQELKKAFTVRGEELFHADRHDIILFGNVQFYIIQSVTPVEYHPNIEILPWDLEIYGNVWKFVVSEFDPSEEVTRTVTHTTTYSNNFEINVNTGEKVKIGGKFGASQTTTHTETYTSKTTLGSEELFEGVLDFRSPIVTGLTTITIPAPIPVPIPAFNTYEVSTGIVSFSVEPIKVY